MELHYVSVMFQKFFSVDKMKKIRWYGYIYDFSVDYHSNEIDDIFRYKYLQKVHDEI